MFTPIKLQPPHGNDISGWMSQSSRAVPHDSVLNRISGVQNGSAFQPANKERTQTVQDGTRLKNNLSEVTPSGDTESSSLHSSQPKICRKRIYRIGFVKQVKQRLLTEPVRRVAEELGIPYRTAYTWANEQGGARKKIEKKKNISGIAKPKRSRFHSLPELKKHCIDRVNELCSERQNLHGISKSEIISQVAMEEGIHIMKVVSWVANARKYSSDSERVSQLPKSTPDKKQSDNNVQRHQSVSGNSDTHQPNAHQLNAHSNIDSAKLRANELFTAPPTVRTDSTGDNKIEKSFAECLQELTEWQNKHLRRM
ncbi:conserved uncharacterized protein [Erwinia sp. Ejp617]|nr:hypothetical protein [Erwinia sp. Ejp617]ADP12203.1 conserved uncharacterized protein [Erwinia sp. Ejp617]